MPIKIMSPAFEQGGAIPQKHTCDASDGRGVSPELLWSAVPEGTRSLVLICDDPDALSGTRLHWVIYNLPPDTKRLPEAVKKLPKGAHWGKNGDGRTAYIGPRPPKDTGTHHYFFKLYALKVKIKLRKFSLEALLAEMNGHILDKGELIGHYRWINPEERLK